MSDTQTLTVVQTIGAPARQVYNAFTSAVALESWFADYAEINPAENGRFYAWWDAGHYATGMVKELEEGKRLVLTWRGQGESADTLVEIQFDSEGNGKTDVEIRHSGLGVTGHWVQSAPAIQAGWEYALHNLQSIYETGLDRRIYDRPMLGIYPSQIVDQKMAENLGLPVHTGVQISGVLPEMGAEAAGLRDGDVLFSLNNRELKAFPDFALAIAGKKSGDTVAVVFYRGAEQHKVEMKLSGRPVPEIPASAKGLAETVAKTYQESDAELDRVLESVTEEEASRRPASEEWSVKEILIHLFYNELWIHMAITCALSDQRSGGFYNQSEVIAALAKGYTLDRLVAEFKHSEALTVASMAALPDEFVADKRKFSIFVTGFAGIGSGQHTLNHIQQIKAAIDSVRGKE